MTQRSEQEGQLAVILVDVLDLEDVDPQDISADMALFGAAGDNCLGLDSIDALEIALAVDQHYGVKLKAEDENIKQIFASLRSLSNYIHANS